MGPQGPARARSHGGSPSGSAFRYLDTGAMYRALTWLALNRGIDLSDGTQLGALANAAPVTFDELGRVWIDGTDVTSAIRQSRIDRLVPVVARHADVREVMRKRQRELGAHGDVVIEGRDIGTVVAPNAEVKVYLVADHEIRASRRIAERPEIGSDALATDLRLRDQSDAARMRPAEDAQQIDTTSLEVDDVVDKIEQLVARARQPA